MTLDVSGGEFITVLNRIAWVAREVGAYQLCKPGALHIPLSVDEAAMSMILIMRACHGRGWNVGQRVIDILRDSCAP